MPSTLIDSDGRNEENREQDDPDLVLGHAFPDDEIDDSSLDAVNGCGEMVMK